MTKIESITDVHWGQEKPNRSIRKRGLPSFPLERWTRGLAFSCRQWKSVMDSFSHMTSRKQCPYLSLLIWKCRCTCLSHPGQLAPGVDAASGQLDPRGEDTPGYLAPPPWAACLAEGKLSLGSSPPPPGVKIPWPGQLAPHPTPRKPDRT